VKRNIKRFPTDSMFQLNQGEFEILKSQIVTSNWGGVRKLPYAFPCRIASRKHHTKRICRAETCWV
ncbi:MAG: ORF6N domain-containing protein, partial [Bacteroidales bacterium]|nr:ORF6N domain-containing protein [Bacteroidales bacterium]